MKHIDHSLNPGLLAQAKRLDRLTLLLRQQLPPECDGHYHVANVKDGTVIIITDSPVWTTRLRQLAPQILSILTQNGIESLHHINVSSRISYEPAKPPERPVVKRELSQRSADLIDSSAECIEDEGLSEALKKLARRSRG